MARPKKSENEWMESHQQDLLRGMTAICCYLHVSQATVLKWIRDLDLPCRKTQQNGGGQWISSRSALDAWSEKICQAQKSYKNP